MNKIKMICLDIDGTLLNSQHKISTYTKKSIQIAANQKKIPVILVSARMPKGIVFLQNELGIAQPIICYSGALILDKNTQLAEQVIAASTFAGIYKTLRNMNVHISLYKDDEWYIEKSDAWAQQESEITNINPILINFDHLIGLWQQKNTGPHKMLCMTEPAIINLLKENITDENLTIYPSKSTYLEIMPKAASKTNAIDFLRKKYQVKQSEILAIGDHYNDIDMLSYAGLGIAMGNAPDNVKKYANAVTLTNDEDGVAEALKRYVLL